MARLSALVVARDEAAQLADCLARLGFADEIVVALDRSSDGSADIARAFGARVLEGAWPLEGTRRNAAIAACQGDWVLEVDADERVTEELAAEIRRTIATSDADYHEIPVDNYIGRRLVRHGWGGSFGKAAYPGLFRRDAKTWGPERVHPSLAWRGRDGGPARKGRMLAARIDHLVDRDISDMLRRLDRYSSLRAADMRQHGTAGSLPGQLRRFVSRFVKCYVFRSGWREGGYGFLIALCAGLYPLLSHLKARLETDPPET